MKLLIVLVAVVALCHGRALEEKKDTIPKDEKPKEPLATRAVLVDEPAFILKHKLEHPDCTKTFPHRHEIVELVKEIPLTPIVKVAHLKEKVNIQDGEDVKKLIARDAEKTNKDELAKKETEKAKTGTPKDDKAATTTASPTTTTAAPKIAREAEKPAPKTEEPKKDEQKKTEEPKKPAGKVRRAIKEELNTKKIEPTTVHLTKDDMKMIMQSDKEDSKRSRRSYGGSATRLLLDDDDDDDDFDDFRSSGVSFATRTLPALRASSYGGLSARSGYGRSLSFARSAPELALRSSGYGGDALIREAPELEIRSSGYGGGALVRDLPDLDLHTRAGYGKSLSFAKEASGYGGSFVREAPELEIRSSGYGGGALVRDLPDLDFDTRAGYGKSLSFARDASDLAYGGAALIREAPELEIRSSGYGGASLVRDLPDFDTRSGYGRSLSFAGEAPELLRSAGYGGALIREAPELEIRSSGYGGELVREAPELQFRSGYGKSLKANEEPSKPNTKEEAKSRKKRSFHKLFGGYGAAAPQPQIQKVEVIREVPVVKEVIREVPVVKEVEVIREVPVVREVEVVREVPVEVRSNSYGGSSFRSLPATRSRASYARSSRAFPLRSSFSSDLDFSDLKESLDFPVVRSTYDDSPVRISFDDDFRSDSRYKRDTETKPAKTDSTLPKPKPADKAPTNVMTAGMMM